MNRQHTAPPDEASLFVSPAREHSHQSILIEILQIALEPNPIKKKIDRILDYLLTLSHLQLGSKAAMFFIEEDSETITLAVAKGFPQTEFIPCHKTRFGLCHCGQVAETGKLTFFDSPPTLLDNAGSPQPFTGNYCVPIVKDGQSLGILTMYVKDSHQPSAKMEKLLGAVANIMAVMIEAQQMDQQLIQLVNDLDWPVSHLCYTHAQRFEIMYACLDLHIPRHDALLPDVLPCGLPLHSPTG